jgi:hypothetical protein
MTRDRVTPELREAVFARDKRCILARLDDQHVCRDQWGQPHMPTATRFLTLEHVHDGYGLMGVRAPSDLRHLVAMCSAGNVGVPTKEQRQAIRAYLEEVNEGAEP